MINNVFKCNVHNKVSKYWRGRIAHSIPSFLLIKFIVAKVCNRAHRYLPGLATSFFNDRNRNLATPLLDLLIEAKQESPNWLENVSSDGRMPSSGRRSGKGRIGGGGGGNNFSSRDYRQQSGGSSRGNPRQGNYGGGYGAGGGGG